MSRIRARALIAAGACTLLLTSLAVADTTAATTTTEPDLATAETLPPDDSSAPPPTSAEAATSTWSYVAFADSWPAGEHCNGCTPFPVMWAEDLDAHPGWDIEFTNFMGQNERSAAQSKGTASLLEALQTDDVTRAAVETADIILIATGPNEVDQRLEQVLAGTCGGVDGFDCLRDLVQFWTDNFDAILTEIETLRDGQPTAIRLLNAALEGPPPPEIIEALGEDVVNAAVALIGELGTNGFCDAAQRHDAICIDIRPVLNGPSLDQPADVNTPETMRVITDLLLATGLPELT